VGEVLLLLEDDEARVRVRQAEANLRKARSEYERGIEMREAELLSAEEFERLENELHLREADLDLAQLELSYTRVSSPLAGRIVRRLVDLGANVSPGTPLFEVMDVEPLLARVHIPAKRMGFVRVGQSVEIRLEGGEEPLEGDVSLVSPIVDPATGTVKVTVEIRDYPPGTRPGDFARVRIVTDRHEGAVLVPSRAIFEEQGESVLYVVEEDQAVRRVVRPGYVDEDRTEILEGVRPGELVVVKGQRQLREGARVEILEGPPEVLARPGPAAEET
jgi:membrane fusion protein (multidrug efflux system)